MTRGSCFGLRSAVVTFEIRSAMRVVADESALQLLVEPPPPPPRPHDHPRRDLAAIRGHGDRRDMRDGARPVDDLRAGSDCVAEEQSVEQQSRDAARRVRKVEFVCAAAADDAAAFDRRRGARGRGRTRRGSEGRHRRGTRRTACRGETSRDRPGRRSTPRRARRARQRRSGRSASDDRDIYFHRSSPKRKGHAALLRRGSPDASADLTRLGQRVAAQDRSPGASFRVIRPIIRSQPMIFTTKEGHVVAPRVVDDHAASRHAHPFFENLRILLRREVMKEMRRGHDVRRAAAKGKTAAHRRPRVLPLPSDRADTKGDRS